MKPTSPTDSALPPALRAYLYFCSAVTGAAIMIVEILGAKMLAPFLGTSHFVWTAQIAVTLVSLALGYYLGGKWADAAPKPGRLFLAISFAALYLILTILVVEPVAYWALTFKLAMGSLIASAFLFFIPLALLAMTGPFFIRALTSSVSNVGSTIGRLSGISTLGSFVGTVLIGYVLVPFLQNSTTMFMTAGVLLAISGVHFLVWERKSAPAAATAALAALSAFLIYGGSQRKEKTFALFNELHRSNSNFGQLLVLEKKTQGQRYYLNDYLTQNTYDPASKQSLSLFTYMLHDLAVVYTSELKHVLCIGMGVGIVPMQFARENIKTDVVEINPAVVGVAERFFDFERQKVNLFIDDGRHYLNENTNRYDAVILDAFLGDSSPSHLMSKEAFESVKRSLQDKGVLVINCFGDFESGKDYFLASLHKTLSSVFPSVRFHASGNGNVFFAASPQENMQPVRQPDLEKIHPAARAEAREAYARQHQIHPGHGIVITDDYNPVEFYDAGNREQFRRHMALSMKAQQ